MSSYEDMMAAQETGWGVDDLAGWGGSEFNSDFSSAASMTAATSPSSGGLSSLFGGDAIGNALVGLLSIEAAKARNSSPSQQYESLQNPAFSANSGATRQDATTKPAGMSTGMSTGMMVGIGAVAVLVLVLVLRK